MKQYDAVIIGFGKGGKTLAADLAAAGQRVAIIERSARMYGGTCINVGCIPTKSLVNSAKLATVKAALTFEEKAALYRDAIAEKERLTGMLREKNFAKLNDNPNVTVYNGIGSFCSAHEIQIEGPAGREVVGGERIFINTGSTAVIPPIAGIAENPRVFTSETLLDLTELPGHLVIVGGGYIGLEFASFYANFGSRVTILQDGDVFLPREDTDIADEIRRVLAQKDVDVVTGVKVNSITDSLSQAVVSYEKDGESIDLPADAVLIATGRKPNTADLNLAAAGIKTTPRGAVRVDDYLRASVPNVWAMGDVAGGLQFTYISLDDYRIVRSQLSNGCEAKSLVSRKNVPYSVFIDPAFSRVGLNEREALEQGYQIKVAKLPAAAIPKAQVLRETNGLLKAVVDAKTDLILGAMLFCAESYEVINTVKLAMDIGLPYTLLRDQVFTHPTMSEALNDLFGTV